MQREMVGLGCCSRPIVLSLERRTLLRLGLGRGWAVGLNVRIYGCRVHMSAFKLILGIGLGFRCLRFRILSFGSRARAQGSGFGFSELHLTQACLGGRAYS